MRTSKFVCLALLAIFLPACVTVKASTHHARILIKLHEEGTVQERMAEYEKIAESVNHWMTENEFKQVPAGSPGTHLYYRSSADQKDLRLTHFLSSSEADKNSPVESLMIYDPAVGVPWVEVGFGEGISPEPSKRFVAAFEDLMKALKGEFGDERVAGTLRPGAK